MTNDVPLKPRARKGAPNQIQDLLAGKQTVTSDPHHSDPVADLCARYTVHLFSHSPTSHRENSSQTEISRHIAYALRRAKLCPTVPFAALMLLRRLKGRVPTARASSAHRLFIAAFIIAAKVIVDDAYSNRSWAVVAMNRYSLREINQMEREMCQRLDWELSFDSKMLSSFEEQVVKDFSQDRVSYPRYSLALVSKRSLCSTSSTINAPLTNPHAPTAMPPIPHCPQISVQAAVQPTRGETLAPQSSPVTGRTASPPPSSSKAVDTTARHGSQRETNRVKGTLQSRTSNTASTAATHHSGSEAGADVLPDTFLPDALAGFAHVEQSHSPHPLRGQMFAFAVPSKY